MGKSGSGFGMEDRASGWKESFSCPFIFIILYRGILSGRIMREKCERGVGRKWDIWDGAEN